MAKTIIIDADGTLTDNKVYYTSSGERIKGFHSRDIRAIRELTARGFDVYILTQSTWPGIGEFASRTGATIAQAYIKQDWIKENGITDYIAIGDDVSDIIMLKEAVKCYCPSDADDVVKEIEGIRVLKTKGGDGVMSEMVRVIDKRKTTSTY